MSHLRLKLGIAGAIFAAAVVYLVLAGMEKGLASTLGVDQFNSQAAQYQGKRIRICGIVGAEPRQTTTSAEFAIKGSTPDKNVRVSYRGAVPDGLREGAEVIVEGTAEGGGRFRADVLMTKCASKYEEQQMPPKHKPTGVEHGGTQPGAAP
jgi:cytochrome c-type biogenesis protein CcmE